MSYFKDLFHRLRLGWIWVLAQFVGTALLILLGLGWTRLPDKHIWQVALTLLVPVLLAISALELQAGTMRRLASDDGKRVRLVWGALTLVAWVAVAWVAWSILDWCDDRIWQWASYLNSKAPPHARATWLSFQHLSKSMGFIEWVLRWLVVPGKLIPLGFASAQWGWRLNWQRLLRLLWNWRWWLAVLVAGLVGVALPGRFFLGEPSGTVSAQIWHVVLKVAGAYLLGVGSWVLLLGWLAVLMNRQPEPAADAWDGRLLSRLNLGRKWVAVFFGWLALSVIADLATARFSASNSWLTPLTAFVLVPLAIVLTTLLIRSMMQSETRPARFIWGLLSVLLWAVVGLALAIALSFWHLPAARWCVGWIVAPALLVPFAAASAVWGLRLPWRKVLRMPLRWKWWLGVLWAAVAGVALPALVSAAFTDEASPESLWDVFLRSGIGGLLEVGSCVILLAWLAVLFDDSLQPPREEALVAVPVLTGPKEGSRSAKAEVPPPDEGGGAAGPA